MEKLLSEPAELALNQQAETPASASGSAALAFGGIAGALASACCIGPLVLASVGLGSIVASVVTIFEPLRPVFIVIALAALGFAGRRVYRRPAAVCNAGTVCETPRTNRALRIIFWFVAAIVLALIAFPYYVTVLL